MVTSASSDRVFDIRGLKDDTKPLIFHGVPVGNGSTFVEIDTGAIYMFDEENQEWKVFA